MKIIIIEDLIAFAIGALLIAVVAKFGGSLAVVMLLGGWMNVMVQRSKGK